jgi:hypothetical protein
LPDRGEESLAWRRGHPRLIEHLFAVKENGLETFNQPHG